LRKITKKLKITELKKSLSKQLKQNFTDKDKLAVYQSIITTLDIDSITIDNQVVLVLSNDLNVEKMDPQMLKIAMKFRVIQNQEYNLQREENGDLYLRHT
jgi:hypothetical protein